MLDAPVIVHPIEAARPGAGGLWRRAWDAVRRAPLARLALALLAADVFFIVVQVAVDATDYGFQGAFRLSLETEGGIAQTYGWGKALAAAVFLGWSARRFRSPTALFWAGALLYLALDDALTLHEDLGGWLVRAIGLQEAGSLRSQDVGEVMVYAIVLATAAGLLILAEYRERSAIPSRLSLLMVPPAGVFVFSAVILDALSVPIALEDGGELVALTALFLLSAFWLRGGEEEAGARRSPA